MSADSKKFRSFPSSVDPWRFKIRYTDKLPKVLSFEQFLPHNNVWHMWLEGYSNPRKMEQSWEYTFLRLFTNTNTKLPKSIRNIEIIHT